MSLLAWAAVVLGGLVALGVAAAFLTAWLLWRRWSKRRRGSAGWPIDYGTPPESDSYCLRRFDPGPPIDRAVLLGSAQPEAWRNDMAKVGRVLRRDRVHEVTFVHGTFTGDDPFAMAQLAGTFLSRLRPELELELRALIKGHSDRLLGDRGNFTTDSVRLFQEGLGDTVPCRQFVWSSANHHAARARAAVGLLEHLAQGPAAGKRGRVLLVAHSHGGQVLAVLSHLIANSAAGARLTEILGQAGIDPERIAAGRKGLGRTQLDFVTFGMPPRYGFSLGDGIRALHIINHRGIAPCAGKLLGVFHTLDGDYIQQWGIAGSDMLPRVGKDRSLSQALDEVLGPGANLVLWRKLLKHRARVPRDGYTALVDYEDGSTGIPNCMATGFGHGVYTSQQALLFHATLITEFLYGDQIPSRLAHGVTTPPPVAQP